MQKDFIKISWLKGGFGLGIITSFDKFKGISIVIGPIVFDMGKRVIL